MKSISRILLVIAPLCIGLAAEIQGQEPMDSSEFMTEEEPISPLSMRDIGFSTMKIPSKKFFWDTWELLVERPQGRVISLDDSTRSDIAGEISNYLGGAKTGRMARHIAGYSSWISDNQRERLEKSGMQVDQPQGIVYFSLMRINDKNIAITGERGSYIAFCFPAKPGTADDALKEIEYLFPAIGVERLGKKEGSRYSNQLCDIHRRGKGIQIRSGMRNTNRGIIRAIRVDIDLLKMNGK